MSSRRERERKAWRLFFHSLCPLASPQFVRDLCHSWMVASSSSSSFVVQWHHQRPLPSSRRANSFIRSFARINSFIVFTPVDLSNCASMSFSQLNRAVRARLCTGALIDRHLLPDFGRGVASVSSISPSVRLIHCPPSENTERTLARIRLRLNVSHRHLRRGERVVSCITILYSTNNNT